jgi:hypothetical protein
MCGVMLCIARPLFAQVPDLTKDTQAVNRNATYNLGATGLRGWIYTKAAIQRMFSIHSSMDNMHRGGKK